MSPLKPPTRRRAGRTWCVLHQRRKCMLAGNGIVATVEQKGMIVVTALLFVLTEYHLYKGIWCY